MPHQEVKGQELIQLLMNALEEGKTGEATELVNRLLQHKVSESLSDRRRVIAERLFGIGEGVEELVKTSNEPENREDPEEVANETGDVLSNSDLAVSPSDEQADGEITEAEVARKRREAAFQRSQKDTNFPLPSDSNTRQIVRSTDVGRAKAARGKPAHPGELPRKKIGDKYVRRGSAAERDAIAKRLRGRLQKRRGA